VAEYSAITATSQTILGVLENACPRSEFASAMFEIYQAPQFQTPMEEGIAVFLYRISAGGRRNLPSRPGPERQVYRPPITMDLHYLLTAWARTAGKQQLLLGWAMRILADTPVLPPGMLNHYANSAVFHDDESVELVFDPLNMQDITALWDIFKPNMQACATYVARSVAIDSTVEVHQYREVQTHDFVMMKATND
jgi:hypothetical protein